MAIATSTAILAGAAIAGAGAIGGAAISSKAAKDAAEAQEESTQTASQAILQAEREARAAQREMFDITREDLMPYRDIGVEALTRLRDLSQPGEYFAEDFTLADFEADPGYQFRLSEGMKALERTASARGTLLSGRTMKDAMRFGQGLAADEFGRAYDRFNMDRTRQFNRQAALAGIGQTSATNLGQFGQQYAANVGQGQLQTGARLGDLATQAGNARASSYAARGQAWGGALQNLSTLPLQYYTLSQFGAGGRTESPYAYYF